jgi:hypothetical protein
MTDYKQTTAVIATFAERRQADGFVEELRKAGFTDDEIGVAAGEEEATDTKAERGRQQAR